MNPLSIIPMSSSFNVSEVVVTRTFHYEPRSYLEYCEESGEEPTEKGFPNLSEPVEVRVET